MRYNPEVREHWSNKNDYDRRALQDLWRRFCVARKAQRNRQAKARHEIKMRTFEERRYLHALTEEDL